MGPLEALNLPKTVPNPAASRARLLIFRAFMVVPSELRLTS
jgi:hypothetical protein